MKKTLFIMALLAISSTAIFFTSCESNETKIKNAEEKVQDANKDLLTLLKEERIRARQAVIDKELELFKADCNYQIQENEIRISELRVKMNAKGKAKDLLYAKRIEVLEDENAGLRRRLDEFDKNNTPWEQFKEDFIVDANNLRESLESIDADLN
jgi:MFS superfamily sulfate permease-like transporter